MSRSKENWYFVGLMLVFALLLGRPSSLLSRPAIDAATDGAGFILVLIGLVIRVISHDWKLHHSGGNLVTDGPYAIVRNPMYLGSLIIGAGLCIIFGSLPFVLVYSVAFLITHHLIARREEVYLRSRYAEEYDNYAKSTPAWFPSPARFWKLIACSFGCIRCVPSALYRERHAIGGNIVGACLLEATADGITEGWAACYSEAMVWVAVAILVALLWGLSGKLLLRAVDPAV